MVLDLLACHLLGECFLALGWELLQHSEKNKGRINLCHCMVGIKPLPQKTPNLTKVQKVIFWICHYAIVSSEGKLK